MQDKHLFEYAVIRVVPKVEREEFMNVGVIVYCSAQRFLQTAFFIDAYRLGCFSPAIDPAVIQERLQAFEQICAGAINGGPIGKLPIAARFRWLTAARSTIIQTSAVHPGRCSDAKATLLRLLKELVE